MALIDKLRRAALREAFVLEGFMCPDDHTLNVFAANIVRAGHAGKHEFLTEALDLSASLRREVPFGMCPVIDRGPYGLRR